VKGTATGNSQSTTFSNLAQLPVGAVSKIVLARTYPKAPSLNANVSKSRNGLDGTTHLDIKYTMVG